IRKTAIRRATDLSFGQAKVESTTLHVMGIAVASISVGMFIGALVEWGSTNRDTAALLIPGGIALVVGCLLWWITVPGTVRARDVFSAVGWTWLAVTFVGALPYLLSGAFDVAGVDRSGQFVNAIFESASGYSCTGSTALTDFGHPGRGTMMYRQITQWYGGMGIVVLAVAVLPFLGVGGLDLMSAEAPGPSGDRLTPRVSETAKRLWATYVLFTLAVAGALVAIPGPSLYDGIAHGLTTASTGGFSPHADSIGSFNSLAVEIAIIIGMVVGGTNFALHWRALRGDGRAYWRDPELRAYVALLVGASALVVGLLWLDGGFSFDSAARAGVFNVVALGTSTGFGTATGTLRRHPDLLRHRSAAAMAKLMELQAALLARAADWVKPGGVLAYGVCSLQPQEGEAQIAQFLEARHDFALEETTPPKRFTPDDNMDGFYLALMRKGGDG
ncbi:MAG: hypothetical protein EBT87_04045, partial [Alphaproteobacteria bacterium]|nr:hypothetical protein [Alphaproteobacteria bacterium]